VRERETQRERERERERENKGSTPFMRCFAAPQLQQVALWLRSVPRPHGPNEARGREESLRTAGMLSRQLDYR
jgi:hypothetical protein